MEIDQSWDTLKYHLPFSLKHFDLTSFELSTSTRDFESRYLGMPPIFHLVVGLFIWATGQFSLVSIMGVFGVSTLLLVCHYVLRVSLCIKSFFLAMFTFPIFTYHLPSGYQDIWTGSWLAISTLAIVRINNLPVTSLIVFCISIFVSVGSKFQALPVACILTGIYIFTSLKSSTHSKQLKTIGLASVICASTFWPVKNLLVFGNPTYPFKPPFIGNYVSNYTESSTTTDQTNTPQELWHLPKNIIFILSVIELPAFIPNTDFKRSIDAHNEPLYSNRMGGWGWFTILFFLGYTIFFRSRFNKEEGLIIRIAISLIIAISFVPQGHELRYWFIVPFLYSISIALFIGRQNSTTKESILLKNTLAFVSAISILTCTPYIFRLPKPTSIQDISPSEAKTFWQTCSKQKTTCIRGQAPKAILWAGPTLKECPIKECL